MKVGTALALMAVVVLGGSVVACGDTSTGNGMIGQAKKVAHNTPIFCENYDAFDLSLGVMENGTGSMSTQDIWLTVLDPTLLPTLKKAVQTGAIVKVTYDEWRFAPCKYNHVVRSVEIVPGAK